MDYNARIKSAITDLESPIHVNYAATANKWGVERTTLVKCYKGQTGVIETSAPDYRGEGPKLEKCPRSEGPRGEDEGESLRITRLGRGIRIYSIAEKCVNSDSKIYNFGSLWPRLLLLILLSISSAFALAARASYSSTKF
jgi:hypothetical protein